MSFSVSPLGLGLACTVLLQGCMAVAPAPLAVEDAPHFLAVIQAAPETAGPTQVSARCPTPARASADTQRMVALVNAERASHGLTPLRTSGKLARAAQAHACDNAARNSFSHYGSDGSDLGMRLRRVGYRLSTAAENTGLGFSDARQLVTYWMNSPGHKANILNPSMTELGLGQADGTRPTWVLDFGRPR